MGLSPGRGGKEMRPAPGRGSLKGQNGIEVRVRGFDPGVSDVSVSVPVTWASECQLGQFEVQMLVEQDLE